MSRRVRDISVSATEDAASFLTGLPIGTLRRIAFSFVLWKWPWLHPHYFLDWELKEWPQTYFKELSRCLRVHHGNRVLLLPQVMLLTGTKGETNREVASIEHRMEHFELSDDIRASTEEALELNRRLLRLRRRHYYNETNLRLARIEVKEPGPPVLVVQGVQYEDYLRTNLALEAKTSGQTQTLRQRIHGSGQLEDLNQSPLANNIGINVLLFTVDGKLIIQRRSRGVVVRPGELAPSSSGTLVYGDVKLGTKVSLDQLEKLRETFEELGLHPSDIGTEITFLALTRELIRGGQPELFFFGSTTLSERDVKKRLDEAKDRFETRNLIFYDFGTLAFDPLDSDAKRHTFLSRVDQLVEKYLDTISIPLWTNLVLWSDYRLGHEEPRPDRDET